MPSSKGTLGMPSIASEGIQEMAVTEDSMRMAATLNDRRTHCDRTRRREEEGSAMAYQFYVTIQGTKQGKFKGAATGVRRTKESASGGKIAGVRFLFETSSPRDLATGQ